MTVNELMRELENYDPDMEVHISYKYGDYWHTQVAPILKIVEEKHVEPSMYHNVPMIVKNEDDAYDVTRDDIKEVLVLS